jgi:integrase
MASRPGAMRYSLLMLCGWHPVAIGTAGRMGAILDLKWDRIDFAAGLIHLDDPERHRTAKGRATVPMNGSARAALQNVHQGALTRYVI